MRHRLSKAAESDLDDLWIYIAQDNPSAADRVLDSMADAFRMLAEYPNAGRATDVLGKGIQRFPVGAYCIFYRVVAGRLEIIRVLHGAREIDTLLGS